MVGEGKTFKSSARKTEIDVMFAPTNLHLHVISFSFFSLPSYQDFLTLFPLFLFFFLFLFFIYFFYFFFFIFFFIFIFFFHFFFFIFFFFFFFFFIFFLFYFIFFYFYFFYFQSMHVLDSLLEGGETVYPFVTVGAPAAHVYKFKHGLRQLVHGKLKKQTALGLRHHGKYLEVFAFLLFFCCLFFFFFIFWTHKNQNPRRAKMEGLRLKIYRKKSAKLTTKFKIEWILSFAKLFLLWVCATHLFSQFRFPFGVAFVTHFSLFSFFICVPIKGKLSRSHLV